MDLVILQRKVAGLNGAALDRFVRRARKAAGLHGQVNVLVTSGAAVRALNRQFRDQNKATDVLSFASPFAPLERRKRPQLAGEIAISADMARENSAQLGHSVAEEVKILALHGILHLAGFDHERDNGQMARKESTLRRALGLPVALIERVHVHAPERKSSRFQRGARGRPAQRTAARGTA
ncbi:MAG TPA: rRNA maturation RNase YbeY [Candidatus Sulfotelmatobacter sp.]|jgi:probable rRNA maturation factor